MFITQLEQRAKQLNTLLCVGLDPWPEFIHDSLAIKNIFSFNQAIIEATADVALCYKPQIAHYHAYGLEKELEQTIDYLHQLNIPVILDAKRGDIGSTAEYYAKEAFVRYNADAVTVNPYLGFDSIAPFLAYEGRGVIVLARTSNPSADWLQKLPAPHHKPLYLALAEHLDDCAQHNPNLLFVVGATDTQAIAAMRAQFPQRWFLIPGIGVQGGSLQQACQLAGPQCLLNVTRAIIYPEGGQRDGYFSTVRQAAQKFHQEISELVL